MEIRQAVSADADAILSIYCPIVEKTNISFESDPPDRQEITGRIASILLNHEWLVAIDNDGLAGYAYASQYRPRPAYRYSVETTVYVHERCRGQGIGRTLYDALFTSLKSRGFHSAYAGVALPNDASVALHEKAGFTSIGVFREAGFKFDKWHDVSWWQRQV